MRFNASDLTGPGPVWACRCYQAEIELFFCFVLASISKSFFPSDWRDGDSLDVRAHPPSNRGLILCCFDYTLGVRHLAVCVPYCRTVCAVLSMHVSYLSGRLWCTIHWRYFHSEGKSTVHALCISRAAASDHFLFIKHLPVIIIIPECFHFLNCKVLKIVINVPSFFISCSKPDLAKEIFYKVNHIGYFCLEVLLY